METSDCLTVIVPVCNLIYRIDDFLRSLPPQLLLIAVDSSTDQTPERIAACRPANTRLMQLPGDDIEAYRIGAEAARSEWLLFTQATVAFSESYFDILSHRLQGDVLYGPVLDKQTGTQPDIIEWLCPIPSLNNLVIRRAVFMAVGGFDQSQSRDHDLELVWRIRRSGYEVNYVHELVVHADDVHRDTSQTVAGRLSNRLRAALLATR